MIIPETLYGEIIFSKEGHAIGALWRMTFPIPESAPKFNFRAKTFKDQNKADIFQTREQAIDWIRKTI